MIADSAPQLSLRSFQHCRKDTDIVCFRLPEWCPLCGQATAATPCRIPPYVLPSPFVTSAHAPRAVVVRPTNGTFLGDYNSSCDLHIGLTDSNGHVTEFDERGLTESSVWPECLVVLTCPSSTHQMSLSYRPTSHADTDPAAPRGYQAWDLALEHLTAPQYRATLWDRSSYNEQTWNCFDLVLNFMTLLGEDARQEVLGCDLDLGSGGRGGEARRSAFCDRFLVDKCRRAGDYVQLYRRVMAKGWVCVSRQEKGGAS